MRNAAIGSVGAEALSGCVSWDISRLTLLWRKSSRRRFERRADAGAREVKPLIQATLQKSFGSREATIRARRKSEVRTSLNQNL